LFFSFYLNISDVCFHPATSSKKAQSNFKKEVSIGDGGFGFSRGSHDNCSITISKKYNQPLKGSEYWRWWFCTAGNTYVAWYKK
jgi:hypothetical protein